MYLSTEFNEGPQPTRSPRLPYCIVARRVIRIESREVRGLESTIIGTVLVERGAECPLEEGPSVGIQRPWKKFIVNLKCGRELELNPCPVRVVIGEGLCLESGFGTKLGFMMRIPSLTNLQRICTV